MRALVFTVIALCLNGSVWAQGVTAPPSLALSDMTVRLCGTTAYPPTSWVSPDGRVEGINAMIVRALLTSLGVKVDDQQNSNWQRCLKEIELGNVDVMTGFRNELRREYMAFLDTPIINEDIYLYYPASETFEFNDWESLADKRIGVLMGDSFGDLADEALASYPRLEWVSNQHQNLLKLADHRLDAVPMGQLSGQLQLATLGLTGQISSLPMGVNDYWYVAISKRSPLIAFLPELNAKLKVLLADPERIPQWKQQQKRLYLESMAQDLP